LRTPSLTPVPRSRLLHREMLSVRYTIRCATSR